MQDAEQLQRDLEETVAGLSSAARRILGEIERGAERSARGEDVTPELSSGFDALLQSERDAVLRALQLSEELHAVLGAENEGMAALMNQAAGVITRAQELEPGLGGEITLGEAIAILERHGVSSGISPELADMVVKVPVGEAETRTVPSYYPVFTDASKTREWDGSEQAEAWAKLIDFRDRCISEAVGHLAGMDFENTAYAGLIALLWGMDEEEAAEFVRRGQDGGGDD